MDYTPPDHFQMPTPMVKLKSSDGEIFEVEVKVARCFLLLKEMLDDLGVEDNEVIPIPRSAPEISGAILGKLIQWANHHKDDPAAGADSGEKLNSICRMSSWDAEFLQVDQTTLFQLIRAANYLNIKAVLDVACMKVAKMLKGMTLEEVRYTFRIQNDFSPDEEEQVRRENAWCDGIHFGAKGKPVNDSVMEISTDSVQDVDNDGGQVNENCLNNSLVISEILQDLSDVELVVFSQLNKMWNFEARKLIRKRSNIIASLDCSSSCQVAQAFASDLKQMSIVPFCALRIVLPGTSSDSCQCKILALDPTDDVMFDPLPFKTLSVELGGKRWDNQDFCRGFQLLKRILHDLSAGLEELSILILSKPENFSQYYDQEYGFPRLKILKLKDSEELLRSSYWTNQDYVDYFKTLISRAPNLREVHSNRPPMVLLSLVEGTAVVPVCSNEVCAPFFDLSHGVINSALSLQRMKIVSTAYGPSFDFNRFREVGPVLLRAPCTSTLCDLTVDTVIAEALVSFQVRLENVRKLTMIIRKGDLGFPRRQRTMRNLKDFYFTRIFPNLTKVHVESTSEHLPKGLNRFIWEGNADLREPMPDRVVNIKELHFNGLALHNYTATYFSQMFPNIERLYVDTFGGEYDFNFGPICENWVNLKELHIKSKVLADTANFDCTFCGIFFDEVVQLMQKDDEYLKRVNIVPVKPSITCLRNLRVLSLEYELNRRPEPIIYDVTNPMFFLSKITGMTAFAKCPNLAVSLKISPDGAHAS